MILDLTDEELDSPVDVVLAALGLLASSYLAGLYARSAIGCGIQLLRSPTYNSWCERAAVALAGRPAPHAVSAPLDTSIQSHPSGFGGFPTMPKPLRELDEP